MGALAGSPQDPCGREASIPDYIYFDGEGLCNVHP